MDKTSSLIISRESFEDSIRKLNMLKDIFLVGNTNQFEKSQHSASSEEEQFIVFRRHSDGSCSTICTTRTEISSSKIIPTSTLWDYNPARTSGGEERNMKKDKRYCQNESPEENVRYYWAPFRYDPNKSALLQRSHICKVLPHEPPPLMGTLLPDYKPKHHIKRCPQQTYDLASKFFKQPNVKANTKSPLCRSPSSISFQCSPSSRSLVRKFDQRNADPINYYQQDLPKVPKAFSASHKRYIKSPYSSPSSASLRRQCSPSSGSLARRSDKQFPELRCYQQRNWPYETTRAFTGIPNIRTPLYRTPSSRSLVRQCSSEALARRCDRHNPPYKAPKRRSSPKRSTSPAKFCDKMGTYIKSPLCRQRSGGSSCDDVSGSCNKNKNGCQLSRSSSTNQPLNIILLTPEEFSKLGIGKKPPASNKPGGCKKYSQRPYQYNFKPKYRPEVRKNQYSRKKTASGSDDEDENNAASMYAKMKSPYSPSSRKRPPVSTCCRDGEKTLVGKQLTVTTEPNRCGKGCRNVKEENIYSDRCNNAANIKYMMKETIDPFIRLKKKMGFDEDGKKEKSANEVLNQVIDTTIKSYELIANLVKQGAENLANLPQDPVEQNKVLLEKIKQTDANLCSIRKNIADSLVKLSSVFAQRAKEDVPEIEELLKYFEKYNLPEGIDTTGLNCGATTSPTAPTEPAAPPSP